MYPDADKRLKEVEHLNQYISENGRSGNVLNVPNYPKAIIVHPLVYYDGEQVCERIAKKRRSARKAFLKIKDDQGSQRLAGL